MPGAAIQRGAAPFPPNLQNALDEARRSGNYYIIVCNAADETADCNIKIFSERSSGFHRGNLVRAWQKAGAQILDFNAAMFESLIERSLPAIVEKVKGSLSSQDEGPQNVHSVSDPSDD